jgi:abortive infection bacteriophage resistance protein
MLPTDKIENLNENNRIIFVKYITIFQSTKNMIAKWYRHRKNEECPFWRVVAENWFGGAQKIGDKK